MELTSTLKAMLKGRIDDLQEILNRYKKTLNEIGCEEEDIITHAKSLYKEGDDYHGEDYISQMNYVLDPLVQRIRHTDDDWSIVLILQHLEDKLKRTRSKLEKEVSLKGD